MKKKGVVPDFSRAKPPVRGGKGVVGRTSVAAPKAGAAPVAPVRVGKPQGTSAKSGQRGR